MSTRPTSSRALAEVLREHAPAPDDVARARMEQRIVAAMSTPRPSRRSRAAIAIGVAVAAAAAVAIFVLLPDRSAPVARFERREASASVERGTLEEGSTLRTAAHEVAEIQVVDSRVRIEGASRVRIATLSRDRLALDLDAGSVRVAFHPRERGRERMTVETPTARVEVVGTVFRVAVDDGETRVSVSEGTVRVVPLDGGAPRLVHAGEETRVGRGVSQTARSSDALGERQAVRSPSSAGEPDAHEAGEAVASAGVEPASAALEPVSEEASASDGPSQDPSSRLAEAQRLVAGGRTARATPILRELTRPTVPASVRTEAWMLMADVHASAGRLEQAARAYEEAAQAGRGTREGHNAIFSLARLQDRRLHDAAAARASYERYLAEAPDVALATQARRALCRLGAAERCDP